MQYKEIPSATQAVHHVSLGTVLQNNNAQVKINFTFTNLSQLLKKIGNPVQYFTVFPAVADLFISSFSLFSD